MDKYIFNPETGQLVGSAVASGHAQRANPFSAHAEAAHHCSGRRHSAGNERRVRPRTRRVATAQMVEVRARE
eukprot:4310184-Prymnesium_polylepis.2